jgi:hypothetical protein
MFQKGDDDISDLPIEEALSKILHPWLKSLTSFCLFYPIFMQLDMQFVQCKSSSHFPNGFLVDAVVRQGFQLHEFLVKLFD